jgi:hypothetical protein
VAAIRKVKAAETNQIVAFWVLTQHTVNSDSIPSTLKKEAAFPSETSVYNDITMWCQKLEDCSLNEPHH